MLYSSPFYYQTVRNTIVTFGSLFSDIHLVQNKDGKVIKDVRIPIAYAGKESYVSRLSQDPKLTAMVEVDLPRMSFEMTSFTYDGSRKISSSNQYKTNVNGTKQIASPTPYNIGLSLHIYTRTQDEALQTVEQILPFFAPDYTVTISAVSEMDIKQDVPFVLNSVTPESSLATDFKSYRYIIYTLAFTAKINLFGPISNTNVIKTVDVNLGEFGNYNVAVTPGSANSNDIYNLTEVTTT